MIFFWGGGWGGLVGGRGHVGGARVDVNEDEELKFLENSQKNKVWGGAGQVGGRVGGGGGQGGCERNVGVGGDVGYGGCEPIVEGIVKCTKRYCTILRK